MLPTGQFWLISGRLGSQMGHDFGGGVQLLSRVQFFVTTWTAARQASLSFTISWSLLKFMSIDSCPRSFPASGSFPMSWLLTSGGQSIGALATVLPMNIQDQFRSPCCPRDSQESSPTPQFESVNSSELSLLYSPTLTYVHDYLKNYSFDYTDSCQQSDVSAF